MLVVFLFIIYKHILISTVIARNVHFLGRITRCQDVLLQNMTV